MEEVTHANYMATEEFKKYVYDTVKECVILASKSTASTEDLIDEINTILINGVSDKLTELSTDGSTFDINLVFTPDGFVLDLEEEYTKESIYKLKILLLVKGIMNSVFTEEVIEKYRLIQTV